MRIDLSIYNGISLHMAFTTKISQITQTNQIKMNGPHSIENDGNIFHFTYAFHLVYLIFFFLFVRLIRQCFVVLLCDA